MIDKIKQALLFAEKSTGVKVHEFAEVSVGALVFSLELQKYCEKNDCGHYNKSWTCPPGSGTMEEQREKIYLNNHVFVFTTKHNLEDSFDYDGMKYGKNLHIKLTQEFRNVLGNQYVFYSAGSCPYCRDKDGKSCCAYPEPCLFPDKKLGSIEAAGINVSELSKTAGIRYNNGPNTVTYFSMILWK